MQGTEAIPQTSRTYDGKDLTFEVPEGWADRSVVAFAPSPRARKSASPSFVVTREPVEEGETLRTFSARQASAVAKGLKDFKLRHHRDVVVSGTSAVQYEFSWRAPNGTIVQRITMTLQETADGTSVLLFTASAPLEQAGDVSALFDRLLASVHLRSGSAHTSSAPPPKAAPLTAPLTGDPPPPPAWWPQEKKR